MEVELVPELLVSAYRQGIFPMGGEGGEIAWYSPDPRTIIDLEHFHVPKRLARTARHDPFEIKIDSAFPQVIAACARRPDISPLSTEQKSLKEIRFDSGVWITDKIIEAYLRLHKLNIAHSLEAFADGQLVGGLYGVAIGGAFMGESMFHIARDASKICLVHLVERLKERGYSLLDCQYMTSHLRTFGAIEISRYQYLQRLDQALRLNCRFI